MAVNDKIEDYTLTVTWSDEDEIYICRCKEMPSLSTDGTTKEEAISQMKRVLRESVEWLNEDEDDP